MTNGSPRREPIPDKKLKLIGDIKTVIVIIHPESLLKNESLGPRSRKRNKMIIENQNPNNQTPPAYRKSPHFMEGIGTSLEVVGHLNAEDE